MGSGSSTVSNEVITPQMSGSQMVESQKAETPLLTEMAVLPNIVKQPCGDYDQNPGTYEDLFRVFKELSPICFDGAKLSVNRPLSSHFQINHCITMNSASAMKFGASYIGTKQYLANEIFPVMVGEMNLSGDMSANLIHQWNDRLRTKMMMQMDKNTVAGVQLTGDYRTPNATSSLHCINLDPIRSQGIFIMQYLQRVTKSVSIGTEYFYQFGQQIPSGHIGQTSLAARYAADNWSACGSINPSGVLHLGYHHHEQKTPLQFGVELESNLSTLESVATLSYTAELSKANCTFKAYMDSNWMVGATLEKRLLPMPFTFILSGVVNNVKQAFKFGVGFVIGS